MLKLLPVWPLRMLPFLRQTKLKGPLPNGAVLKVAVVPGHWVRLVSPVALILVNTLKPAQFVTLPEAALTLTLYVPVSALLTELMLKLLLVWPLRMFPFLRHTKLNGPVPELVVVNVALVPGQLVRLTNGVALIFVNTVRLA